VEILGEFAELAHPGVPIPEEVIRIHGISNAMVRDRPGPTPVLDRFFAFCGEAVLMAHYAPFDVGAIAFAYERDRRAPPKLLVLDTFLLPRRLFPGAPNYALETLVQFLGLPSHAAHRALPDAQSTLELFRRCVSAMGSPEQLTVGELVRVAGPMLS